MKKAQSTLEYVLVLTAVIAAIIFAVGQFLKPRVQTGLDHVTSEMQEAVERIDF